MLAHGLSCRFSSRPPRGPKTRLPAHKQNPTTPSSRQRRTRLRGPFDRFRVPAGLKVELFAAEPLLANPVAFCIDEKGRFYVAETFRLGAGVTDTRGHMNWLDDDLACRTVADRVAMYKKYLGKEFESYKVEHERVRQVVDRDGDGKADAATVFADGFNDPAAGIGAGLLARNGDVWYACIPWLWKLRDAEGDREGRPSARSCTKATACTSGSWATTCTACAWGPTAGSTSASATAASTCRTREGRKLAVPDTGSVLRCNPDGTELEVFATGLRNPQELAFDEYGNLFTGDNNSDSGDKARWVYVVEGGDSGWRIGYQFIEEPVSRGPWNEEKLWDPARAARRRLPGAADRQHRRRTVGPGLQSRREPPARPVQGPLLPRRLPRRQRPERHPQLRGPTARAPRSSWSTREQFLWGSAGHRRRLRARRSPLLLRLGRRLGQAGQGADLPRARSRRERQTRRSARSSGCWPKGCRSARAKSSRSCWLMPT